MNKFEEFIVKKYPNRSAKVLLHKLQDNDGTWFYAVNEVQDQSEAWQSRQAEVDEANAKSQMCRDEKTHAINRWSQIRKEVEEKDKRIESALYALKGLKAENDLWGCDQVEVQIEILEKALRGEQ